MQACYEGVTDLLANYQRTFSNQRMQEYNLRDFLKWGKIKRTYKNLGDRRRFLYVFLILPIFGTFNGKGNYTKYSCA